MKAKTIKQVEKEQLDAIKKLENPFLGGKHRNFLEGLVAGLSFILITEIKGVEKMENEKSMHWTKHELEKDVDFAIGEFLDRLDKIDTNKADNRAIVGQISVTLLGELLTND